MDPGGLESTFERHANSAQANAKDPEVAAANKPRDVEFRKIGEDYLMRMVKPGTPGFCQVLFSVYRENGIEQLLVEAPVDSEVEAFQLAKNLSDLSDPMTSWPAADCSTRNTA